MCYEGMPGEHALCGYVDCIGSQFCYRSIFQRLKSLRVLKFDSALYRLCDKVSVWVPDSPEAEERKISFPSVTVY